MVCSVNSSSTKVANDLIDGQTAILKAVTDYNDSDA
jgi:hypothetical protein